MKGVQMATPTKTTAEAEVDTTDEVNADLAIDETALVKKSTSSAKKASTKTATTKAAAEATAPPSAKAPAKKAPVKRGTKAAAADDEGGPDDDLGAVVVEDTKGDDSKNDTTDDSDEEKEATSAEALPSGALVLSLVDDEDEVPVYSSAITGATADPVKDYLKQIGKVALLNAAE